MLRRVKTAAAAAACAMLGWGVSANAEAADPAVTRGVAFTGYDYLRGSNYEFAGAVVALNGNLGRDGYVLHASGAFLDYDLNPGLGRGWQGDMMLGYIFSRSNFSGGIYAGVDYQDYKLSPDDPTVAVRGAEWGFKVSTNLQTSPNLPYYLSLNAAYTGSFNGYWARARAGINRQGLTLGPEAIAMGNDGFDAHRLGGFLSFTLDKIMQKPIEVTLAAGHHFLDSSGPVSGTSASEGTYAGVTLAVGF